MLAEVPGQSVNGLAKRGECGCARMLWRQAGLLHLGAEFEGLGKIAVCVEVGKAIEDIAGNIEGLADFAGSASTAKGDDVSGHGRAVLAVTAIDFLDDALAAVATGQIDVDVGPGMFSAFGKETFEQGFEL